MSIAQADIDFATELFAELGALTTRKMMGGLCLYHDGTIFAIIHSSGQIFLKGAGDFQAVLDAKGLTRWTYSRDGKKETAMPYWALPEAALDDPELACDWARRALAHLHL
ncbi:TfoX-like protein [Candidatus Rhodobacter oscarellae]|uniref:TfoX-like protein n=1 Tax=Candidatus Rhodobacter oscarellae TaxID=1675527 RepID=A0A0J9E0M0_9RHOB|nr:TfoX/Sxy family protein [Candidatus Rhodobacter lobularis]KMW56491.1 TfoX-like protein [Candidatus Rhodobacter lobularis]